MSIKTRMHSSRMRTGRCSAHHFPACTGQGGVSAQGVYLPRGCPCPGGSATHLPPVNRITDACKNMTILQLHLRAVTIGNECINGHLKLTHSAIKSDIDVVYKIINFKGLFTQNKSGRRSKCKSFL